MTISDPRTALEELRKGNARFVSDALEHPALGSERRSEVARGQQPFAAVLSCADSRVPAELVFDRGLGDLFVVRTAGQVVAEPVLGSLQYGVAVLGVPLLLVLGHTACGAVQAAVDAVASGAPASGTAIDSLVAAIRPAAEAALAQDGGTDAAAGAVRRNVEDRVASLRADAVLGAAVSDGRLEVVGGVYDLTTGVVTFL